MSSSIVPNPPLSHAKTVRQAVIERLIRAVSAAGQKLTAISVRPDGTVLAHLAGEPEAFTNDWDEVLSDEQAKRPAAKRH